MRICLLGSWVDWQSRNKCFGGSGFFRGSWSSWNSWFRIHRSSSLRWILSIWGNLRLSTNFLWICSHSFRIYSLSITLPSIFHTNRIRHSSLIFVTVSMSLQTFWWRVSDIIWGRCGVVCFGLMKCLVISKICKFHKAFLSRPNITISPIITIKTYKPKQCIINFALIFFKTSVRLRVSDNFIIMKDQSTLNTIR